MSFVLHVICIVCQVHTCICNTLLAHGCITTTSSTHHHSLWHHPLLPLHSFFNVQALATLYLRAASILMKDGRNIDHLLRYNTTSTRSILSVPPSIFPLKILIQYSLTIPSLNTPPFQYTLSIFALNTPSQYFLLIPSFITLSQCFNISTLQHFDISTFRHFEISTLLIRFSVSLTRTPPSRSAKTPLSPSTYAVSSKNRKAEVSLQGARRSRWSIRHRAFRVVGVVFVDRVSQTMH